VETICTNFLGKVMGIVPQGNIIRYTVNINKIVLDVDVLNNERELYQMGQQVFLRVKKDSCINL
jgi:putative spermidine/putrescine transport system ATP-binding protein